MGREIGIIGKPNQKAHLILDHESMLLVQCAHLKLSQDSNQTIRDILIPRVNWDILLKNAAWHRLAPLVAYHLTSPDLVSLIPKPIITESKNILYQSLARNIYFQDELCRILSIFNQNRIPVIILKGSALLKLVYQDISLRPMGDLDILIRPEHLSQAESIALNQGYSYLWDYAVQETAKTNQRHLANMRHDKKGILLEIHQFITNPEDPYHFDLEELWKRALPTKIQGTDAFTLSLEDLLVHLTINFILDRRYSSSSALGQLCDISEILIQYKNLINWNQVLKITQENGLTSGLHYVLYACERILCTPIPVSVVQRIQPHEFDANLADLFLKRRVLDTKPWQAHNLVNPKSTYNQIKVLWIIIFRFFKHIKEIFEKNHFSTNTRQLHFGWIKYNLPKLLRTLLKPSELKEDLLLDRWLHDLLRSI